MTRRIVHRTRGHGQGPIVRLMSPSNLGEVLKPFVFLDLFEADMRALAGSMPVHPHSGIATVTVFADGDVTFDDPQSYLHRHSRLLRAILAIWRQGASVVQRAIRGDGFVPAARWTAPGPVVIAFRPRAGTWSSCG